MKIKIMGFGRRGRALFLRSLAKLEILTGDPRKEMLSGMESFPDPELDPWKSLPWELLGAGGFSAGGSQEGSPRGGQMGTGKPKDPHFDPSAFRSAAGAPSTPPAHTPFLSTSPAEPPWRVLTPCVCPPPGPARGGQ